MKLPTSSSFVMAATASLALQSSALALPAPDSPDMGGVSHSGRAESIAQFSGSESSPRRAVKMRDVNAVDTTNPDAVTGLLETVNEALQGLGLGIIKETGAPVLNARQVPVPPPGKPSSAGQATNGPSEAVDEGSNNAPSAPSAANTNPSQVHQSSASSQITDSARQKSGNAPAFAKRDGDAAVPSIPNVGSTVGGVVGGTPLGGVVADTPAGGMVGAVPGIVADTPVGGVPGTVGGVPGTVGGVPGTVGGVPGIVGGVVAGAPVGGVLGSTPVGGVLGSIPVGGVSGNPSQNGIPNPVGTVEGAAGGVPVAGGVAQGIAEGAPMDPASIGSVLQGQGEPDGDDENEANEYGSASPSSTIAAASFSPSSWPSSSPTSSPVFATSTDKSMPSASDSASATTSTQMSMSSASNTASASATSVVNMKARQAPSSSIGVPSVPISVPSVPVSVPSVPVGAPSLPAGAPQPPVSAPGLPANVPGLPIGEPSLPIDPTNLPGNAPNLPVGPPTLPVKLMALPLPLRMKRTLTNFDGPKARFDPELSPPLPAGFPAPTAPIPNDKPPLLQRSRFAIRNAVSAGISASFSNQPTATGVAPPGSSVSSIPQSMSSTASTTTSLPERRRLFRFGREENA